MTREEFQRLCRERIVFLDGPAGQNASEGRQASDTHP